MGFKHLKAAAAICGVALFVSGCQSTRNIGSADAEEVAAYSGNNYAENYAVQAGLIGAAGGAIAGCVVGQLLFDDCGSGALLGGGLGAVGGAFYGASVGTETEGIAEQQVTEEEALAAADRELQSAQAAEHAAARVVGEQQAKLNQLREQAYLNSEKYDEYESAIEDAKGFQAYLGGSVNRVQDAIDEVDNRIELVSRSDPDEARKLLAKRADLHRTKNNLDRQLATLITTIENHDQNTGLPRPTSGDAAASNPTPKTEAPRVG